MADLDKFLNGDKYVTGETLTKMWDAIFDILQEHLDTRVKPLEDFCQRIYEKVERVPSARPLEQDKYLLDVAKTLLAHSAESSPEEIAALSYLKGIVDAALPPEESNTRIGRGEGGVTQGGEESTPGAGEGVHAENSGAALPDETEND